MGQMWSFIGSKQQERWLWHAIDHHTGQLLAYVLAPDQDAAFKQLKSLLSPFGSTHFYTDGWGADERDLEPEQHTVAKANTQLYSAQTPEAQNPEQTLSLKNNLLFQIN